MYPRLGVCILLMLPGGVSAQVTQFLASDGNRLYRGDLNGNVEPFITLSAAVQSLTRVPEGFSVPGATGGDIIATAADPVGGAWRVYRLDDPFGTPGLTQIGTTTVGIGSLAFAPGGLYAVHDSANPLRVARLSMADFSVAESFSTGVGVSGGGGIAYDVARESFYLTDATNNRLMQWNPGNTASAIGPVGVGFSNNGLEYLNGALYGALRLDSPGSQMRVGSFDTATGGFTSMTTITGILGNGTGFVTIPAPGAAVPLVLLGMAAGRRPRRKGRCTG